MKKILTYSIALTVLAGCGTSAAVSEDCTSTEETVDIGYGTVSKNSSAFSSSGLKVEENDEIIFNDIYDYLRNRVPGVEVGEGSNPTITVRGTKTIGEGRDQAPLFYLDGQAIPNLSSVHPMDVHSINVLKGPAASAYGSQSANGVILITSKFAYEAAQREAAAKKAAKEAKKVAKKGSTK